MWPSKHVFTLVSLATNKSSRVASTLESYVYFYPARPARMEPLEVPRSLIDVSQECLRILTGKEDQKKSLMVTTRRQVLVCGKSQREEVS